MISFLNELLLGGITSYLALYINIIKPKIDKELITFEKENLKEENWLYYENLKNFFKIYKPKNLNITKEALELFGDETLLPKYLEGKDLIVNKCSIKTLKPIINTFYEYMPGFSFWYLGEKLETLTLEKRNENGNILYKILGSYNFWHNTIYLNHPKPGTLEHEFIHAASTRRQDDIALSGFSFKNEYYSFFNGLNEGFTEILNKRIFGTKKNTYEENVKVCECLELLFDSPKELEQAYFLNDIDYLYQGFLKYGTKEEFAYLNYLLDVSGYCLDEKKEMNNLILEFVKRTNDEDKIRKASEILSKKQEKKLVKIFR